ncbi:helix-turn-helix domain-containing protein [Nocardioides sp. LHD-245]|uniref:PucR family transcriptional regulator n=1 Tax=Nocardioides sp. LHD-245 TaxID=3051387 RepID=UPI0027E1411C|nr:helix-turn-helix domain-containing protein [Nocardioides sp. LHD-245]
MADRASDPDALTGHQLVALPMLAAADVLGGGSGLVKVVRQVLTAPTGKLEGEGVPGCVVLLDGTRFTEDTFEVDFALRWAANTGASMLVVVRPASDIGLASRRLANKVAVPLVVIDADPVLLADGLREQVLAPARTLAEQVINLVERLGRVTERQGVEGLLATIDGCLDAATSLVGYDGVVLVGEPLDDPLPEADRLPVQTTGVVGDRAAVIQPVALAAGEAPTFWLVTQRRSPTSAWRRAASTGTQLASTYIATRLIANRLEQERDARFRLGVLNSVIASAEFPEAVLVEQIGTLGWKVDGWCTAVHVLAAGPIDQQRLLAMSDDIRHLLGDIGLDHHLVERPDGWTTWITASKEPPADQYTTTTKAVAAALRAFASNRPGLRVYAGIGRPYVGIPGLRKSLGEAQEAVTIAQAGGTRTAVKHVDEMGVQRILVGWYASEEFRAFATTLLRPLTAAGREDELLKTLEVYLDNESSPTVTAEVLGVHRNTVIKRVARIRDLLAVDLDEPDQRLAVQLACRVSHLLG